MRQILLTNCYSGIPLKIVQDEIPSGFDYSFLSEQSYEMLLESVIAWKALLLTCPLLMNM